MLVLNIKYAKLGIFKNACEFWFLVFVESEWNSGLYLNFSSSENHPASVGLRLPLWSCKASSSREADCPFLGFCNSNKLMKEH